ncbi:MAG TPA: S-layer homology domain-containing protein [Sedimentibacter sp.]|nr:S-layer homology domain-containing protein [Sedimentibacter sp.]
MKRALSGILIVLMILQMSYPAFAYTSDTINNSIEENETILDKLENMYGDDLTEEDILNELSNMGLLDDEGKLNVSESIMVDGTPMTLYQVKQLLNREGVDLSKKVTVDGTRITLADLKIMIEIEEELARLKKEYFENAVPLTEDHNKALESLFKQIEREGIELTSESTEIPINNDLRLKVDITTETFFTNLSDEEGVTLHLIIVDKNGNWVVPDYDISFKIRTLDGSAKSGTHYQSKDETITISKDWGLSNVFQTVTLYPFSQNDSPDMRWNGEKKFYIQLYDPVNILFEGDARNVTIPVTLNKSYSWVDNMGFSRDVELTIKDDGIQHDPSYSTIHYYLRPDNGFYSPYEDDGALVGMYNNFIASAEDISGSFENAEFEYLPYIKIFTNFNRNDTITTYPLLQVSNNDTYEYEEIQNAQYGVLEGIGVNYYNYGVKTIELLMLGAGAVDPHGRQLYFKTYGVLPDRVSFTGAVYTNSSDFTSPEYMEVPSNISEYYYIIDKTAPSVKNITAPAGEYQSGQVIPITVEFSEPVKLNNIQMRLQDGSVHLSPAESSGTISKYATFLYTVPKNPDNSLLVRFITGIVDINYNKTEVWPDDGSTKTISGVEMGIDKLAAFKDLYLSNEPSGRNYEPNENIEVKLDVDTDISDWLEEDYDLTKNCLKSVYIKAGDYTYPLTMGGEGQSEGSFYTASIPAANYASASEQNLNIKLYMDGQYIEATPGQPIRFEGGTPVIDKKITATIDSVILVTSINLDTNSYPENNMIYTASKEVTQLKVESISPQDATFTQVKWESSNEEVATINETTGVITPGSPGVVTFTAVCDNGGFGSQVTADTPEFTVAQGGPPAIVFPAGNNSFFTKKNEPVKIAWSQNLIGRTEGLAAEFDVAVYSGYYLSDEAIGEALPVYTASVVDKYTFTVPENKLPTVSAKSVPSYTVRVSAENPDNPSETLSDLGYIIVYPLPARVKLSTLDNYYITDETTTIHIEGLLEEFSGGEFEFKIVKNQETIPTAVVPVNGTFTCDLNIDPVPSDKLKDIYTVSAKAKNTQDSGWSTDSFVLHVYNKESMKILVDNQDVEAVTLDNNSYIKNLYQNSASLGILALRREISLRNFMSINSGQYPWGSVTDRIEWKSDNSKIASVNYKQGTLYENIEKFDYTSYRPSTEFMLAGNSDGTTTIRATHGATGMTDSLLVDVKTLKDKLYIFNFYPRQETLLTYVNGNGETVNLTSNDEGEIAVYEESGIASSISLKSGSNSNVYLGTLYNERLKSAEKDPGIYELYPVNIFELRPAAKVELFFKNSDGEPFTGQATYRGAVYKNGKICLETVESGGETLSIGSDGRFTLNLDSTRFWTDKNDEELSGSDKLVFIYEVIFNDSYYPQLIEVNGSISAQDTVKFGESIVNLIPVSTSDKNKPFVLSHKVNYNLSGGRLLDVTRYTGAVGPGNIYKKVDLESIVTWWGYDKKDGYDVKLYDEYGAVISGQKVKTILYPWAQMAYTKNITTLTEESLNLAVGAKKGARVSIYDISGTLVKQTSCPFLLTNMVGAPEANDEDKGVKKAAEEMNENGNLKFDGSMVNNGDSIIGKALELMSGTSLGGQNLNLKIIATEDPMVYRGLVTIQQGMGSTDVSSVTVEVGGVEQSFDYTPDAAEMIDMIQKSADDIEKELSENMEKTVSGDVDYGLTLTGYFEVEVRYDYEAEKWVMVVIGGGFDVDALIGYTWKVNQMAGPVPLTFEFGLGAASKLEFRAVKPYGNVPADLNPADLNDFFTALRIKLYISAFGGFGFDYSIVALKIGVFGKINLDYELEFLNRSYLGPPPTGYGELFSIELGLTGQVGIKFVAKVLFISYEAVLASYEYTVDIWKMGNPELIEEWKSKQGSNLIGAKSLVNTMYASDLALRVAKESLRFEDRDYLDLYDRAWGNTARRSMKKGTEDTKDIQTNSYPYSNPLLTNDGVIMAYMSDGNSPDINETRASWALLSGGEYQDQGPIQEVTDEAYADNNLAIDGNSDFAVAAWEQQKIKINTEGALTESDISAMINSSEILAGVYDGHTWETTPLTNNLVSDMGPVSAANDDRAVVAWRSLAGSGTDRDGSQNAFKYDDVNDSILYKVYENGAWSDETYTLYNGSSGNIKGMSAAMMPDGTTGITYTLDYGTDDDAWDCETILAIIDENKDVIADVRLTNNDAADLNPQIAVVDFGGEEGLKFVVGWYNTTEDGIKDIKFAAADKTGNISNRFIDSISSINENSAVIINDSFRFVKNSSQSIDDLTIIWVEPTLEYDDTSSKNAENDCLKAVKFMRDSDGKIYLTAPLDVATMANYTLIDHLDAYSDTENTVKAVMLCSTYEGHLEDQGNGLYTVDSISSMKYAEKTFENNIGIRDIYIDYSEIKNNFRLPIVFTVTNMGIEGINSINISLQPDDVEEVFDNLNLLPNQSISLTVDYDVPGEDEGIHDLNYSVGATFTSSDIKEKTGLLNLDVPDAGISRVELVSDEQGKRVVQLSLHNSGDVPLAGGDRKVYAGIYTSSLYNMISEVDVAEITGNDLKLLDEGALTMRFTYTLPSEGIPSGGVRLYARIWVEEEVDGRFEEITEYNTSNNQRSILIANPVEANMGNPFLVTVEMETYTDNNRLFTAEDAGNDTGKTLAHVRVKNLSMTPSSNGNVILHLLDNKGNVIETRYLASTSDELLSLGGEESKTRDVLFSMTGSSVRAQYFAADPYSMDPTVSGITLDGIGMNFDENVKEYTLNAVNLPSTLITATSKNPAHVVEIRNPKFNWVLASGTGSASYNLSLPNNDTAIVEVKVINTETLAESDAYKISVTSTAKDKGTVLVKVPSMNYDRARVYVTAENLAGFEPIEWQVNNNGQWSELMTWNMNTDNIYTISKTGGYTLSARLFDEEGYYMDSNTVTLRISKESDEDKNESQIPEIPEIPGGIFTDVPAGSWYHEAVTYLASKGIIKGVGNGMFAPNANIKRADFLIMVMNAYGIGLDIETSDNFTDAGDTYYTKYLAVAKALGLVSGIGENKFAPESFITRQDMTVILYRILEKTGKLPQAIQLGANAYDDFLDKDEIAGYAQESMRLFVESKIISGYDNRLHPFDLTTRAQAAQILYNLLK